MRETRHYPKRKCNFKMLRRWRPSQNPVQLPYSDPSAGSAKEKGVRIMPIRRSPRSLVPIVFLLTLILSLVTIPSATAAEPSSPVDLGTQHVSFVADQVVPQPGDTTISAIADRAIMREFHKKYPQYEVIPFTAPAMEGVTFASQLAVATGTAPAVTYVNFRISSSYISRGFLEPMETILARTLSKDPLERSVDSHDKWLKDPTPEEVASAMEQLQKRIPKPAWPAIYRDNDTGQSTVKHVWCLPTSTDVMALVYRKDLFNQAGIDHPPRDWDEMIKDAEKLTVPSRQQYGLGLITAGSAGWMAFSIMGSNRAKTVDQDAQGKWHVVYGDRKSAEAIYFLWRLMHESFMAEGQIQHGSTKSDDPDNIGLLYEQGKLGMRFDYLEDTVLSQLDPQRDGFAPLPGPKPGVSGGELNCAMLGVYSAAPPAQKIAAMRLIWYVTSDEAIALKTKIMVENGYGPLLSPTLLRKFHYDRLLEQVPKDIQDTFDFALKDGIPEPYGKDTQNIYTFLGDPVDESLQMKLEGVPPEKAIDQIQAVMKKSADECNFRVFGEITPAQLHQMHIVAWLVLALAAIAFGIGGAGVWRYFSKSAVVTTEGKTRSRTILTWALLLPALIVILGWGYIPLVWGGILSFTDFQFVLKTTFVGVDNFAHVLYDPDFWASMWRTVYYVALTIGLGFWPPILLAILLAEVPTSALKYIFRTIYYLPAVISGVILMFFWKQLYDSSKFGVLNQLLLDLNAFGPVLATIVKLGAIAAWLSLIGFLIALPLRMTEMSNIMKAALWAAAAGLVFVTIWPFITGDITFASLVGTFKIEPLGWIDSPQMSMFCVVLPSVWAGAGPGCLLYLAALMTVPSDLYEAAEIDGCGIWHKICYITLPKLKFLIGIQFIFALVGSFKGGTDFILAMTGGGPSRSTMIVALDIFMRSFMEMDYGVGAAMAWILGALLVGLTAYQMKKISQAEFKTAR
jgi:multiple sugar transport system permease protein